MRIELAIILLESGKACVIEYNGCLSGIPTLASAFRSNCGLIVEINVVSRFFVAVSLAVDLSILTVCDSDLATYFSALLHMLL